MRRRRRRGGGRSAYDAGTSSRAPNPGIYRLDRYRNLMMLLALALALALRYTVARHVQRPF